MTSFGLAFGGYRLEGPQGLLRRGDRVVPLPPKATLVLWRLASQAGRLVTKEQLLEAGWPDTAVTEAVLTVCISNLRKRLGDTSGRPRYIETVHRRGYRFVAPVTPVDAEAPSPTLPGRPASIARSADPAPTGSAPLPSDEPVSPAPLCVGREAELAGLGKLYEAARRGQRQVVFVTGDAGMGKTTLVDSFIATLPRDEAHWMGRGQCVEQHGAGEPYLPLLEALAQLSAGPAGGMIVTQLSRYAPSWLQQLPSMAAGGQPSPGAPPSATQERMLRELADLVEAIATARPVVLLLEDLHWSDPSTVDAMTVLARRRAGARLLVIGTFRPVELVLAQHPLKRAREELSVHRHCATIVLGPLGDDAVAAYLESRAGTAPVGAEIVRFVQRRTDGHPLFVAAVTDYLIEQGVLARAPRPEQLAAAEAIVPGEVQEFIEIQISRLGQEEQRVLEAASVAGLLFRTASVAAAAAIAVERVEQVCEGLAQRGSFVEDRGGGVWPDGSASGEYQFRHALYQQGLYRRIAASRRIRLHQAIGLGLEAAYGARASEIAAELAVHFERGRDHERAVRYYRQSAANAVRRSAYPEALGELRKGLALLDALLDESGRREHELRLSILLGTVLTVTRGQASEEVASVYARASQLARLTGQPDQAFVALRGQWISAASRGQLELARDIGEQLLALSEEQRDLAWRLEAHRTLGPTRFFMGDVEASLAHTEQGLGLYDREQHRDLAARHGQDPGVACLCFTAWALWHLGHPDRALARMREALRLADEIAHPPSLVLARYFAAVLHQLRGEVGLARAEADAAVDLSNEHGFAFYAGNASMQRGWAIVMQGDGQAGLAEMQRGLSAYAATGAVVHQSYLLARLAEAQGRLGHVEAALATVTEALELVEKNGERVWEADVRRLRGELILARHRTSADLAPSARVRRLGTGVPPATVVDRARSEAETELVKAVEVARGQRARSLELRAATSLARLWRAQGRGADARAVVAEVYRSFSEGLDTADLEAARGLLRALERDA